MQGAYCVAVALLIAASGQAAANFGLEEPHQAPDSDFMASADTIDEMLQSRVLQVSHYPKDDLMLLAGNEERMLLARSNYLTKIPIPESIMTAANTMRMEGEASAIEAASKNVNQLRSNKRQPVASILNNVARHMSTTPDSDKFLVAVENDRPLVLAKRQRSAAITENGAKFAKQDDYRPVLSGPFTTNDEASNGRHNNQLFTLKALQLDKNENAGNVEDLWQEKKVSNRDLFHLLDEYENSAYLTVVSRLEANAIEAISKNSIRLESNKGKPIAPTPNIKVDQELYAPPDTGKSPVLVSTNIPYILAKRLKNEPPSAIIYNVAGFLAQHDYRPAPSGSSAISADAPNGQLDNQLITQKAFWLDKNKHIDDVESLFKEDTVEHLSHLREGNGESAHFTAVDRQSEPIVWPKDSAVFPQPQKKVVLNEEVNKVHEAFLKAFNLPFHQYLRETVTMLGIARWKRNSSPNSRAAISTLKIFAKNVDPKKLPKLLGTDFAKLQGDKKKHVA
uniref:Secreted RxLR effector protein 134 n=1 Tax=Plasmopara viticola TaxID=143451 RepID=RL134_PLAVT|nr:RecName: Full=Secreted RxLR effector protein 134; Flags: Precursor [Plasmopara viticola]